MKVESSRLEAQGCGVSGGHSRLSVVWQMNGAMGRNRQDRSVEGSDVMTDPDMGHKQVLSKGASGLLSALSFQLSAVFLLSLCFFFILLPCLAHAAVSVTMSLDRKEATLADSIRMTVSVSGTRDTDSTPTLHGLDAFHVTGGGTSSRLEVINGQVNSGIDFTFFIQPKDTGTFEVGPAEVFIDGKAFKSNKEILKISNASRASGMDRGPLFLTAEISSGQTYVDEQTLYTLKLFRKTRVSDISLALPEKEYLSFKQLGKPLEYQSVYNGQSYQVLEIRYSLTPSREGDYTIEPSRINLTVYQPRTQSRRSLFDDPFFNDPFFSFTTGRPMALTSEPASLKVLPLPQEGRPADFSGLVGAFQIESKLEPPQIKAGESATLTVLLKGRGNVHRIPDLKIPELDHAKVYADQPVLEVEAGQNGLEGSKTMKWALVPEKEGHYEIPPLIVSFFDTDSHKYRSIQTSPLSLSVLPGQGKETEPAAKLQKEETKEGPSKQAVKELGHDILPVHTSAKDLEPGFPARPEGIVLWVLLSAPFFVYGVAFWATRWRKDSAKASTLARRKKAAGVLMQTCRKDKVSSSDLADAIRQYLNDRLGLSLGSLTPGEAFEILTSRGVRPGTAQKLQVFLQRLEDDIYSGKGQDACHREEDFPKLVKEIEKDIR
jgi:hypothetical protein